MDYAALKAEIDNDPSGKGYAQYLPDSPGLVVELLNAQTETMVKSRYVTARTVLAECGAGASAILDKLEAAATSSSAMKWAVKFLGQDSGLDVGNAVTQAMLDQLAGANVLTSDEASTLKAMALQPTSRAEALGIGRATEQDLIVAGVV